MVDEACHSSAQAIAQVCAVCNEARIECKGGLYKASGAPTEAALVVLAEKLGVPDPEQQKQLASARSADPENCADVVQQWYCKRYHDVTSCPPCCEGQVHAWQCLAVPLI
jgi:Ca2+-transporting ATPase